MRLVIVVCPDDPAGLSAAAAAVVAHHHSRRQLMCLKPLAHDDYNWQRYSYALQTGTDMMHRFIQFTYLQRPLGITVSESTSRC